MRTSNSFNSSPTSHCKHLLHFLKSPCKKRTYTRSLWFRRATKLAPSVDHHRRPCLGISTLRTSSSSVTKPNQTGADMVGVSSMERSRSDIRPFPSPGTPAVFPDLAGIVEDTTEGEAIEDACLWFEWCLTEMVVNKGMVRDVRDVEDLVRCWNQLKSPVFVNLVCRFYVEVCMDLFFGRVGIALYDDDADEDIAGI